MTIQEGLSFSANQFAERIAFVEKDQTITYQGFFALVCKVRLQLMEAGVLSNQVVAVKDENSIAFAAALYAVMGIGAVAVPVYHLAGTDEWNELMQKANVSWIFGNEPWLPSLDLPQVQISVQDRKYRLSALNNHIIDWKEIRKPVFIRFTSGTTGISKGVVLSEQSIWGRIDSANAVFQLNEMDTVIWVLPMAFHFVVSIMLYLRFGCRIVLCNSPFPSEIAEKMQDEKASFFYGSPLHIKLLSQSKPSLPKSLRWVISTSSGIQKHVCDSFFENHGIPVSQAYGIIEFGLPFIHFLADPAQMESIGFVTPGFEACIFDEEQKEVPALTEGKMAIRGKGAFEAYLSPWKLSIEAFQNGWFFTGDIAVRDERGRFFIKGREKSMVNLSGLKVFPEEVEEVIVRMAGVESCKVYGQLDSRGEEELCAEVVLKIPLEIEEIKRFCRESLALYKIPKQFRIVESIGETLSGKIKR